MRKVILQTPMAIPSRRTAMVPAAYTRDRAMYLVLVSLVMRLIRARKWMREMTTVRLRGRGGSSATASEGPLWRGAVPTGTYCVNISRNKHHIIGAIMVDLVASQDLHAGNASRENWSVGVAQSKVEKRRRHCAGRPRPRLHSDIIILNVHTTAEYKRIIHLVSLESADT